jgi:hypothetical protein
LAIAGPPGSVEQNASQGEGERAVPDRRRRLASIGPEPLAAIAFVVLLGVLGWMSVHYRQTVVRLWPESAAIYNVVGLPVNVGSVAIRDIDLRQENQDGTPVLSVTGRLVNITDRDQPIPRLRVVVHDRDGRELTQWTFDPGFASLPAGAEHDFGTRLTNPPPDTQSVNVNFVADEAP